MMKRCALFLCFLLTVTTLAVAQGAPPVTTSQVILPVNIGSLTPATQANMALVGNPGPQTIYYWLVSNFTLGASSPAGPFLVINAPNVLSGSNYVALSPVYPSTILSVDVLKTSSPTPPSGACNCAVATGVTSGTVNDQSNSTSAYTVAPVIVSNFTYTLTNEVVSTGKADPILRQNGVLIADLANITPGGIISANQQVIFNSAGALVGSSGLLFNPGTSALTVAGVVSGSSFSGVGAGAFNAVGACGSLPAVSGGSAGIGFAAGCIPSANVNGTGWQAIVLPNQSNGYASNTFQSFPGGSAVIGSVASDLGGSTPIGALYILQNGLHGNPHLTFFDGSSGEQSMTPNDSACDLALSNGCTGTGGPIARQVSPSFVTPFLGDFTATSGTFNLATWDVFDYSLFAGGTASCTASPAAGHTKGCYSATLGLTASYNGDAFSKVIRAADSVGCAQLPALTGDTTSSAGTCGTTTVALNGTTLSGLATGLVKITTGTGVPSIANDTTVASTIYAADSGAVNAYVVTLAPAMTSYVAGTSRFCTKLANAATGASTVNVNALGAKNLMRANTSGVEALGVAGDTNTTDVFCAIYDGTEFVLQNPSSVLYTANATSQHSFLLGNGTNKTTQSTNIGLDAGNGFLNKYASVSTTGIGVAGVYASSGAVTIGSGANIAATSLCSTAQCPAGRYNVKVYIEITTACTTTGSYIPWLGFTDDAGAKAGSSTTTFFAAGGGLGVTPATATTGLTLVPTATTDFLTGDFFLTTTGVATGGLGAINYGTTAGACGTGGPMVGKMFFDVLRAE